MSSAPAGGSGGNNNDENFFKNVFSMLPPGLSKEGVIDLIKETCGIDDKTPDGQDILVRFTKSKGFLELFEPTPANTKSSEPSPRRPSVEDPTFSALINDTIIGNQYQNKLRVDVDDIISSLQLDADDCIIMDDDEDHDQQEVEKVVIKKEKIDDEPKVKTEKIDKVPENTSIKIKEEKIDSSSTSLKEKVIVKKEKEEKSDNEDKDSINHHKKKKKKKKHSHKEEKRRIINDSGSEEEDDIDVKKSKKEPEKEKEKSSESEKKDKKHKKKDKHRKRDKSKDSHNSSSNSSDSDDEGKIGGSNLKSSRPVKVGAGKVKSDKIEISPPSKKFVPNVRYTFLKPPPVPVPTRQKEISLSEADIIQNEELEEERERKRMEEKAKREKEYRENKERSKQREAHQPKKKVKEEVKEEEIVSESFYNKEQAKLKSKIYKPFIDTEFAKYQKDFGLKTCSIITFDLLTMGSQFKTYGSKDGDPTAIVEKVREKVLMPIERIKDVQKIEKCKKHSYEKKLNKMIDWKDLKEQGITDGKAYCKELRRKEKELEKEREKERKERERERQERKDKERKERELQRQKSKQNVPDIKREKSKHVKNVISSSSSSDSEDERKKKKESSSKNKSKTKDKSGEYTSAGVRILPFERPREETIEEKVKKAKERILADKHKQDKTEKQKAERAQKLQERINADNLRTIGYNSYKIPKLLQKAQKLSDQKVTTSTPLTDTRVDLKFEKFCKVNRDATRGDWLKHKEERERGEREKMQREDANKPSIWDVGADDFHSDEEVVEKPDEYDEYVPPPISEVEFCPLSHMIFRIIKREPVIELGVEYGVEGNPTESCAKKIAWWLKLIDTSEYISEISCPELDDETISFCSDQGSLASFLGNVSDIDDDTQCNVISSTASIREKDPDLEEEFCGQSLLNSRIRKEKDIFIDIFDIRPGSNYDKATTFQAKCNICEELIVGTKHLAAHIRSELHRDNLRNLSLSMAKPEEKEGRVKEHKIKIRLEKDKDKKDEFNGNKNDILEKTSTGLSIKIPAKCQTGSPSGSAGVSRSREKIDDRRRRTRSRSRDRKRRSRSRSPRSRRRSRSPGGKRRSKDRDTRRSGGGGGGRRSRSPYGDRRGRRRSRSPHLSGSPIGLGNASSIGSSSKSVPKFFDTREFQEQMRLTIDGLWGGALEEAWNNAEKEGKLLDQEFENRKLTLAVTPENHPKYNDEWTEYWERRYLEVEKEGKNPDTYDYIPEWKDFWLTRVDLLLRTEQDIKRKEIKAKYRIDLDSLLRVQKPPPRRAQPPPAPHNLTRNVDPPPPGLENVVIMNRPMSISSGSNNSVTKRERPNQPAAAVTAEDCKNKWASLTGVKPATTSASSRERERDNNARARPGTNPPTNNTPTKVATTPIFDSGGFDLVSVLRLMTQNDEQLSFYAEKIKEYYLMAEEMDTQAPGMSWSLIKEKYFVELMFKCRDRFMNLIKANILQRDVIKSLNLTVYAMTEILENDECQKFKPPPSPPPQAAKPQSTPIYDNITGGVSPVRSNPAISANRRLTPEEFIKSTLKNLHVNSKLEIAQLTAKTLLDIGKEKMNSLELVHFLHHVLTRGDSAAKFGTIGDVDTKIKNEGAFSTGFGVEENLSNIRYEGRALPPLPLFEARASSPPRAPSDSHLQPAFATNQEYSRRAPPTSGRRSPFSRRDFSGNPDKDERKSSRGRDRDQDRYRRRHRSPEIRPTVADEEEDWDRDEREEEARKKRGAEKIEIIPSTDTCEDLSDGEIGQDFPNNSQPNPSIDPDQISEGSDISINIDTNTSFLKNLEKISSSSSSPLKSKPAHGHGKSSQSSQLSCISDNPLVKLSAPNVEEYERELQPSPPLSCVMSDAFSEKGSLDNVSLESGECSDKSPTKSKYPPAEAESESIPNFNSNLFSDVIECLKYSNNDQDKKIHNCVSTSLSTLSDDQINFINSKWEGKSKVDELRKFSPGILTIVFNEKLKELLLDKEKEALEDGEIPIVTGIGGETNLLNTSSNSINRRNSTSSHHKNKSKRRRRRKRSVGSGKSSNSNSSSNPNRKRYRSR